jgi:hypothetical protein
LPVCSFTSAHSSGIEDHARGHCRKRKGANSCEPLGDSISRVNDDANN